MGADEEPRWRKPVDAEERRGAGNRAGRARPVHPARADDADHRPLADYRSGLQEDFQALPREPGRVRRRLRQGVVQAAASRHGAGLALSRALGSGGAAALPGPCAGGHAPPDRRCGHCRAQGQHPRFRPLRLPAGLGRLGVCLDLPRHRQARRRQRGAHPPRAAVGLGRQCEVRRIGGAGGPGGNPAGVQRRAGEWQDGLARRPDRAGRLRGRGGGREEGPDTMSRSPSRRGARMRRTR